MYTTLTRGNPFRSASASDPLADIDAMFGNSPPMRDFKAAMARIRLDVRDEGNAYSVVAGLPCTRSEDIHVLAEGRQVTIEVERGEDRGPLHGGRYYGKTWRCFALPQEVDGARCRASYADGVLKLTLPKKRGGVAVRVPAG